MLSSAKVQPYLVVLLLAFRLKTVFMVLTIEESTISSGSKEAFSTSNTFPSKGETTVLVFSIGLYAVTIPFFSLILTT